MDNDDPLSWIEPILNDDEKRVVFEMVLELLCEEQNDRPETTNNS